MGKIEESEEFVRQQGQQKAAALYKPFYQPTRNSALNKVGRRSERMMYIVWIVWSMSLMIP
jgi:hypothetical protein